VLIVQGYGSILGLSSPSSYIVQELLLNFWPTQTSSSNLRESMQRIIPAARPTDADQKFVLDICISTDKWWEDSNGIVELPSFEDLDQRFTAKMEQVSICLSVIEHIVLMSNLKHIAKGSFPPTSVIETRGDLNHFLDPALYPLVWWGIDDTLGNLKGNLPSSALQPAAEASSTSTRDPEQHLPNSNADDMDVDRRIAPNATAASPPLSSMQDDETSARPPKLVGKSEWPAPPPLDSIPFHFPSQKQAPPIASLPSFKPIDTYLSQTITAMDEALKQHAFRDVRNQSGKRAMLETLAQIVNVEAKIEMDIAREIENLNQETFNVQLSSKVAEKAEATSRFPTSHASSLRSDELKHPAAMLSATPIDGRSECFECVGFQI